jgi:hypothetical protein
VDVGPPPSPALGDVCTWTGVVDRYGSAEFKIASRCESRADYPTLNMAHNYCRSKLWYAIHGTHELCGEGRV